MSNITVQAIVLRSSDYRDYDRILTLLAKGTGQITAAARACRRHKSPLLNASIPFVRGEFVLTARQGRYTVTSCQVAEAHYALRSDPLRLAYASYFCALAEEVTQPGQPSDELFELLLRSLAYLSFGAQAPRAVGLYYLVRLLDEQGIGPVLDRCSVCGARGVPLSFSAQGAGAVCRSCAPGAQPQDATLLDAALQARWEPPADRVPPGSFDLIAAYASAHFDKAFRPLEFIQKNAFLEDA